MQTSELPSERDLSGGDLNIARMLDGILAGKTDQEIREMAFEPSAEEPVEIAGLSFRKLSYRAFKRAAFDLKLNIILLSATELETIPAEQVVDEVFTLGWMQSTSRDEVNRVWKRGTEAVEDAVEEWQDEVPFEAEDIRKLMTEVLRMVITAKMNWFRLIPRNKDTGKVTPPGNS